MGSGAIVLPGVAIGDGAVVTRGVAANNVVAEVPARPIKAIASEGEDSLEE